MHLWCKSLVGRLPSTWPFSRKCLSESFKLTVELQVAYQLSFAVSIGNPLPLFYLVLLVESFFYILLIGLLLQQWHKTQMGYALLRKLKRLMDYKRQTLKVPFNKTCGWITVLLLMLKRIRVKNLNFRFKNLEKFIFFCDAEVTKNCENNAISAF